MSTQTATTTICYLALAGDSDTLRMFGIGDTINDAIGKLPPSAAPIRVFECHVEPGIRPSVDHRGRVVGTVMHPEIHPATGEPVAPESGPPSRLHGYPVIRWERDTRDRTGRRALVMVDRGTGQDRYIVANHRDGSTFWVCGDYCDDRAQADTAFEYRIGRG